MNLMRKVILSIVMGVRSPVNINNSPGMQSQN